MRLLLIFVSLLLVAFAPQKKLVQLTVAVDDLVMLDDALFDDFEAANPGVEVIIKQVTFADRTFTPPQTVEAVPAFMEDVRAYASQGDVLFLENTDLSLEAVRTGAFLDLSRLLDATPDSDDFHPALLSAFEWEGALYALPVSGAPQLLMVDRLAFESAGLPYPTTLDELIQAVETLTDAEKPVFHLNRFTTGLLLRAVLGHGVETLDDLALVELVEKWQPFVEKHVPPVDPFDLPVTVGRTTLITSNREFEPLPLPGGAAGISAQGFAVSAGTVHAELSYALADYLTRHPDIINIMAYNITARRSLQKKNVSPLIQSAFDHALPYAEQYFVGYADRALSLMPELNARSALKTVDVQVKEILAAISPSRNFAVATPVPTLTADTSGVTLTFGLSGFWNPLPNRTLWDAAVASFIAADSEVTHVRLDNTYKSLAGHLETEDCFYLTDNVVPVVDLSKLVNLDLLLQLDFDESDMVFGTMAQVTREGSVWGIPVSLSPVVMWYHRDQFEQARLPFPENGWTISEFEPALRQLGNERPPFRTEVIGETYLFMLIAAYGGHLIEEPATYRFDDPQNIEAVRQVLDLGRDGYIHYQRLSGSYGGFFGAQNAPLYISSLDTYNFYNHDYNAVTFPRGVYTPVSYMMDVAYISAASQHPEACYRFIRHLTEQVGLFSGMPARRSMLDKVAHGEDLVRFYREFDALLQRPDVIVLHSPFSGSFDSGYTPEQSVHGMALQWLRRTFDAYVFEDIDLEAEMKAIQQYVGQYSVCVKDVEAVEVDELSSEESAAYFGKFTSCAGTIDPNIFSD